MAGLIYLKVLPML